MRYSEHFAGRGRELLDAAREKGLEGSLPSRRRVATHPSAGTDWIKLKVTTQQDFIICGYILGEREPFGALVLGYHKGKKLVYAGNVGSGFTQQTLKTTYEKIEPLVTKKPTLSDVPREIGTVTW